MDETSRLLGSIDERTLRTAETVERIETRVRSLENFKIKIVAWAAGASAAMTAVVQIGLAIWKHKIT